MKLDRVIKSECSWEDRATLQSDLSAHERRCQGRELDRYGLPFSALCFLPWQWPKRR